MKMDRSKLEKDFLTPYGDKKDINSYREVESHIKSNHDALDIWRGKIQEAALSARQIKKRVPSPLSPMTSDPQK